jgi:hypothetical protein
MKIEELLDIFEGKTTIQVEAIRENYIGKEIVIEGQISDISDKIFVVFAINAYRSLNKYAFIDYNKEVFKKQLLDYSSGTNVIIKAKLVKIRSNSHVIFDYFLNSITKA